MARVRADPVTTALAHPTRRALYIALANKEEMSTVQLQAEVNVERYNLYHHLKKLASLNLVENHRDAGRSRWWKKTTHIDLPEILSPSIDRPMTTLTSVVPGDLSLLPETLADAVVEGGEIHIIQLEGSRDQVGAKLMLQILAKEHGIELDLPWNFLPVRIALIANKK
ncbi:helix-turn-helix domain-containing protein [Candidatus Poseidoniaceae archaeon]|nr:helix-turn-helix domain-containing protein [Candidatus Poseidoniaceae archaeon]|tara:strand:+ start:4840 stop:5343 length:504 start_codon:yes stop_codon:yes gene_type:complete